MFMFLTLYPVCSHWVELSSRIRQCTSKHKPTHIAVHETLQMTPDDLPYITYTFSLIQFF